MQSQITPTELAPIIAFLERASVAKDTTDVNVAAGIALQNLGVLPSDASD